MIRSNFNHKKSTVSLSLLAMDRSLLKLREPLLFFRYHKTECLCMHGTLILILLTDASTGASSILGTVAALAVFVTIIAITLLGLLITIFVIIVKMKLHEDCAYA